MRHQLQEFSFHCFQVEFEIPQKTEQSASQSIRRYEHRRASHPVTETKTNRKTIIPFDV